MSEFFNSEHDFSSRCGITIFPSQNKAIDHVLGDLAERCPAPFVLLADSSGQIISMVGDRGTHNLVALASLVAGDMAASQEIARLTGEYKPCQLILRQGQKFNLFIIEAGSDLVLFAQVNRTVPLGWSHILIHEAARQIESVVQALPEEAEKLDLGITDEKLDSLVGDTLDAMWRG